MSLQLKINCIFVVAVLCVFRCRNGEYVCVCCAIFILEEYTLKRPSAESSIDVWFLGGAASRVPQAATASYNRNYPIMIGIEANWSEREDSKDNVSWARNLHTALQPYSSGGNYLNFPGYDQSDMLIGDYGENLTRLRSIKSIYDPHNLFPGLLNIPPA